MKQRRPAWLDPVIAWLIRSRFWIIVFVGLGLTIAEFIEHSDSSTEFKIIQFGELFFFILFLVIIAFLLEWLIRTLDSKSHAVAILNAKHLLAQQLDTADNWQELTDCLQDFLNTLAPQSTLDLLFSGQDAAELQVYRSRDAQAADLRGVEWSDLLAGCQECNTQGNKNLHTMKSCNASKFFQSVGGSNGYCLPIAVENAQLALIHIYLAHESTFTSDQVDILNNLSPDIALAMNLVQHRIASSEQLVFNTAVSTRSEISHDLHDTLGQNISYLQFKLDQFTRDGGQVRVDDIQPDLLRMHTVASESLDLLRMTLIELQPDKQSRLANYLREYGRSIGERANFDFYFSIAGTPISLTASSLRQLSYVYREVINNIEKHAEAKQVQVYLSYTLDSLTILIEDNGKGYDPEMVRTDRHFGIKIMQERMAAINGSLCIDSRIGAGTRVTVRLPFEV